jgi:hypothetical protein
MEPGAWKGTVTVTVLYFSLCAYVFMRDNWNIKGKVHHIIGHQGPRRGIEVYLYAFSTSALGGGGWSAPRLGLFTPSKDPYVLYVKESLTSIQTIHIFFINVTQQNTQNEASWLWRTHIETCENCSVLLINYQNIAFVGLLYIQYNCKFMQV